MPWYHYISVLNPLCACKTFVEVRLGKLTYICITSSTMLTSEGCTIVCSSLIRRRANPWKLVDYLVSMAWDRSFLYFFLKTWIIHQYHPVWGCFLSLFAEVCSLLTWLSCVWKCVLNAGRHTASVGLSARNLKESDHWLLHLILGKSKCEKSFLKQYLHHQVGSRMFMKAVCHITCNLPSLNRCISYFLYAPRRGKKCQNYLA